MANFIQAFNITMGNEGGYVNNPNDPGGETYAGIAHNFWPNWQGWTYIHTIKAQSTENLDAALKANSNLQAEVQSFYKVNFWDVISLDYINSQQIANQLFDTAVNMGVGMATRFLQQGVNNLKPNTLTVDGVVGAHTIAAVNTANAQDLYNQVIQLRRYKYLQIIAANPSQAKFEHSWLIRLTPYDAALPA
jgi:lysozyme family protein